MTNPGETHSVKEEGEGGIEDKPLSYGARRESSEWGFCAQAGETGNTFNLLPNFRIRGWKGFFVVGQYELFLEMYSYDRVEVKAGKQPFIRRING